MDQLRRQFFIVQKWELLIISAKVSTRRGKCFALIGARLWLDRDVDSLGVYGVWILPSFLYPSPLHLLAVLILAHLLDYAYPFHRGILLKIHPVHTAFYMAKRLGKPYSSKLRGVATWFIVVGTHLGLYASILYLSWLASPILWILVASWIVKTSFSLRLLLDIVRNVYACASRNDWGGARFWTQQIVRRNVYELDEEHVLSAAIESLAESLVDGYTSPLFYYALFGPLGALFQRLINTLDGALGFLSPEYRDVGWFSARMDTVVNYVPARLTALIIVALARDRRYAYAIWRRFCRATQSINAGHPMSAMAGALRVRLEKPGSYILGEAVEDLEPAKLLQALSIAKRCAYLWLAVVLAKLLLELAVTNFRTCL